MADREKVIKGLNCCAHTDGINCIYCPYDNTSEDCTALMSMDVIALLKEQEPKNLKDQPEIVRCKDCKNWDKTTREEGNDCILGPWEDAVCNKFRYWDGYGDLGENFGRTNGDWFCADGERREDDA